MSDPVIHNPWKFLKHFTDARIALGRAGNSLPTKQQLAFQSAHALARDAVKVPLNWSQIESELSAMGLQWLSVHSQAADRLSYLQRPDLGRQLRPDDYQALQALSDKRSTQPNSPADITIVIADGLSSQAIQDNASAFLAALLPRIKPSHSINPIILAQQARVALGDEIGQALNTQLLIMLVGERPGLSAANSMGIYLTYQPRVGRLDAERNCLSNIREGGMSDEIAAEKTEYLIQKAFSHKITGVALKEEQSTIEHHPKNREILQQMLQSSSLSN